MFPEPFGRPMVRRDEAMRGVHVPPPRGRGPGARTSRIVWIGGLIAAGLGVIAVTAFLIATGDDVEQGTSAGQGAAAVATDASTAVAGKSADGGAAAASSSSDKQGDPGTTPPADSKADAGADDKAALGDTKAGEDKTASLDTKPADDAKDAGADDRTAPADTKSDDKLAAADTKPDDKVPADTSPAVKAAPADTKPADKASADTKPADKASADTKPADKSSADTKPADKSAPADTKPADKSAPVDDKPAEDKPAEDKPVDDKPAKDSETRRRPVSLITLQIDSLPRGAAVIRKKDGVRLGETPFTYETEPQSSPISVILRHKGYRDEHVSLPGNRSADRRIPLTRSRGSDRAPSLKD
jgi:hypothetical protein